jgi:hypothetical protein
MINTLFQIILSTFLVLLLAFIGYSIFNRDLFNALLKMNTIKKEIRLLDGLYNYGLGQTYYDTINPYDGRYIDFTPSVNQSGGAEYSYNFWLYLDKAKLKENSVSDKILFFKGTKTPVYYNYKETGNCMVYNKPYFLVKNPLIRLADHGDSIIIEYNTLTNPDALNSDGKTIDDTNNCFSGKNNDNMLGIYNLDDNLYNKQFFMVTVVLKETSSSNDILYKNNTNCKMYINGTLVLDRNISSPYNSNVGSTAMRFNKGRFWINPKSTIVDGASNDGILSTENSLLMSNLFYYNYALDIIKISKLYDKGFNKNTAALPGEGTKQDYTKSVKLQSDYSSPKSY